MPVAWKLMAKAVGHNGAHQYQRRQPEQTQLYQNCQHERLVAFSCKKRGWCPSCGASRMADSAAHLVDEVLPQQPIRQWVLSVPFPMRLLFATYPDVMSKVLGIVYRVIATHLGKKAGFTRKEAQTGRLIGYEVV